MAERYVLVSSDAGETPRLVPERPVEDEHWLQEQVSRMTDLIPAEDLGLCSPLLVVGLEAPAGQAGSADLVVVDMTGEVMIAELKRGPDNPYARIAIAQVLDYGAHIWGMTVEEFDRSVVQRYFNDPRCHDPRLKGKRLAQAADLRWGGEEEATDSGPTEFDPERFEQRLRTCLTEGRFTYVIISTHISEKVRRVLSYLTAMSDFQAFGLEISYYSDGGCNVYVPVTISPADAPKGAFLRRDRGAKRKLDRDQFLDRCSPPARAVFERVLDFLEATQEEISWETASFSFRPDFSGRQVSILFGYLPRVRVHHKHEVFEVYFADLEKAGIPVDAIEAYRKATEALPGFEYTKTRKTGRIPVTESLNQEDVEALLAAVNELLQLRHTRVRAEP